MEKVYDSIASEFSITRNRPWKEFEDFRNYLTEEDKVLDVGCGNGRLYDYFKDLNINYTGVDISRKLLDEARKKHPEIRFVKDDMRDMKSVGDERFDCIFFVASFHHLPSDADRLKALKIAKKLLKDGGKILMTNWNLFQKKYFKNILKGAKNSLFSKDKKWNDVYIPFTRGGKTVDRYYHAFTSGELRFLFDQAGLKVIKSWKENNYCHVLEKK